jgi:regulator of protease activity HflC (stomatin/prohibitin superfamily)
VGSVGSGELKECACREWGILDEYGIKVVRVGLNRGVQKEIYHAGLIFVLPFGLQQMYRLPKGIQVLELTNFPQTAAEAARKDRAAHIQTSDGFFVDVDVSMLYHIKDPDPARQLHRLGEYKI